jgi:orotate phosphoribosyltransferase
MQLYKENIYELSSKYEQCVLRIEHVLASGTNFKFYTGSIQILSSIQLCNI